MPKIFISYRRDDSRAITDRIAEHLAKSFGGRNIFIDIDDIRAGNAFPPAIMEALHSCDIALIIIGKNWLSDPRLKKDNDWVHREVATVLGRPAVKVIPILVDDVSVPEQDALPLDLADLAIKQAVKIRYGKDFYSDIKELIKQIGKPWSIPFWREILIGVIGVIAGIIIGSPIIICPIEPAKTPTLPLETSISALSTQEPTLTSIPQLMPTDISSSTDTPFPTLELSNTPLPSDTPPPKLIPSNTPLPSDTPFPTLSPSNTPNNIPTLTPIPATVTRDSNLRSCPALFCPKIDGVQSGDNVEICGRSIPAGWVQVCDRGWLSDDRVSIQETDLTNLPIPITATPPGTCETAQITYVLSNSRQLQVYWTPPSYDGEDCLMTVVVYKSGTVPELDKIKRVRSGALLILPQSVTYTIVVQIFYEPLNSFLPVDETTVE